MEVLMMIINKAMEIKMDRKSVMIALGGGVIGDMTGFAAAIFLRGIKFVQIPTTLMAMVDSSVGGKTAVNHPLGKNMIGSFHQPDAVIIDKDTLVTLKDREFYSGISEIIKYGLIKDADFFQWQEKNMDALVRRDSDSLTEAIFRSCLIKADIVAADEKEGGIRATLNLGHTFGHAIESGMGYGMWLHGEAVGTGIAMAAKLSRLHGYIDETLEERIQNILRLSKLPNTLFNSYAIKETGQDNYDATCVKLTASRFLDLMSNDKKVADGQLNLILLQGSLGNCIITNKFDPNILKSMITEYCNTYVKS
jgi:3-dehydroquinate synthase